MPVREMYSKTVLFPVGACHGDGEANQTPGGAPGIFLRQQSRRFSCPWSCGGVPGAAGDTADPIMGVAGANSGVICFGSSFVLWML